MCIFEGESDAKISYVPVLRNGGQNLRPGERSSLNYLHYMLHEAEYLNRGDVLIFDGEKALFTESVQNYLNTHGITPFVLPSTLHEFLSPCDNNFHSLLKSSYYRLISSENLTQLDLREKLLLVKEWKFFC